MDKRKAIAEALALTRQDVDFENNTINVSKTLVYISNVPTVKPYPKSENGICTIRINEKIAVNLDYYLVYSDFPLSVG